MLSTIYTVSCFKYCFIGQEDPIVVLQGHTQMANYWYERMYDASDILFRMEQSQLTISSNGTSVFSSEFSITGTRVEVNGQNVHQMLALQALQRELKQQAQQASSVVVSAQRQRQVIHPQEFTNCIILDSAEGAVMSDESSNCSSRSQEDSHDDTFMGFSAPSTSTTQAKNCPFMYDQPNVPPPANSFFSTTTEAVSPPQIQLKEYRVKGRVSIFLDAESMCHRIEFMVYPDMERYEEMKARLMLIRARHNPDRIR